MSRDASLAEEVFERHRAVGQVAQRTPEKQARAEDRQVDLQTRRRPGRSDEHV